MAAQIHGDDAVRAGQQRRDRVPLQKGAAEAVEQQNGRSAAAVVADGQRHRTINDQFLSRH